MTYTTWSLFEEPYWLDCVAPGSWDAVEVRDGGELIGRLPYYVSRRIRITYLANPFLTPWLGPWVGLTGGKYTNELSHQHKILVELIAGLPKRSSVTICCAPEFTNLMPFHWEGFELGLRYTYRLEDLSDQNVIWSDFRENIRRECRKAEKRVTICSEPAISRFLTFLEKALARRSMNVAQTLATLERIDDVMAQRGQRRMYFATDGRDAVHAAIYIVFDERCAFYLSGGSDPELRKSGAHSLLIWEAIKDSSAVTRLFDFEGSMIRPVERFFRAFGARQVPRYVARKESVLFSALAHAKKRLSSGLVTKMRL